MARIEQSANPIAAMTIVTGRLIARLISHIVTFSSGLPSPPAREKA